MTLHTSDITGTDLFCGAGGFTEAATKTGVRMQMAVNHWPLAIRSHNTNFPDVDHDCADLHGVNPKRYRRTRLLVGSPECDGHTLAAGKPRPTQLDLFGAIQPDPAAERSRALMWDIPTFAAEHGYEVILLENVVEVRTRWTDWDDWLKRMGALDYNHQILYLNSQFFGVPQSRDRMYMVFWQKTMRAPDLRFEPVAWCPTCAATVAAVQSWKRADRPYGKYGARGQYWYRCPTCTGIIVPPTQAASTVLDWSLPLPRVDSRRRAIKPKTLDRIAAGLARFGNQEPAFLLNTNRGHVRPASSSAPAQTSRQEQAVVLGAPWMVEFRSSRPGTVRALSEPISTVTADGNHHGLVVPPFLMAYYGTTNYHTLAEPVATVPSVARHALVLPTDPATVGACGFRMLEPPEIQKAMGFRDDYIVLGSKRDRVAQLGNAVTPSVPQQILERVLAVMA